jgi:PAS domain S-box-containing protein
MLGPLRVLHVEDTKSDAFLLQHFLRKLGYDLTFERVETSEEMKVALDKQTWDVVISDYNLPQFSAPQALSILKETGLDIPFIVLSGAIGEETAVEMMHTGANDYVMKDNLRRLGPALARELQEAKNRYERKQAREEGDKLLKQLQESNAILDALFNNAPIGLVFCDQNLRFARLNEALAEINGIPIEAHIGKTVAELLPEVDADVMRSYRHVFETGESIIEQETRGATPAAPGKERFWLVSYYPVKIEGRIVGVGGVCQEITEKKLAQQERENLLSKEQAARAQAEEANRLKDEFLSTISHELRTPLTSILGWSSMLSSSDISSELLKKGLSAIARNAEVQKRIIDDLLDTAQIITGKLNLIVQPIDLISIIEHVVESLQPASKAKNIQIEKDFKQNVGVIDGDPDRLQQVVWNLLSNAIKFTPIGGRVRIDLKSDKNETQIVVSDTGLGIKKEFLPYVFDRFRQEDGAITREHGGLGLGLAIVRHLVELHGGTVEAQSEGEGHGAVFTVKIPFKLILKGS